MSATAMPMKHHHPDANQATTLELEASRRYRFRYLVDGKEWPNDWHADD